MIALSLLLILGWCIALFLIPILGQDEVFDAVSWWSFRRWRIYCPNCDVSHLFERMGEPLINYNERFVSPCEMNEIYCGVTPVIPNRIQMIQFTMEEEEQ